MEKRIKMVMVGSYGVGKSCLVRRYIENTYRPTESSTIGTAFHETLFFPKQLPAPPGQMADPLFPIKVHLWDTAGAERYRALAPMYLRGANVIALVYDDTTESRDNLPSLMNMIRENAPTAVVGLMMNKCDLVQNVPHSNVEKLMPDYNFQVSAQTGEGVHTSFNRLLSAAVAMRGQHETPMDTINLDSPMYGGQSTNPTERTGKRYRCC